MKKIMSLGGNYYQMTAVKAAKRLGYHVIDVDYLPDNPAHKYADEYYNISTLDKKAVLELARKLQIDGIMSYGSDVSAPTAAYVAEILGLPTNPLTSVEILTRKDRFRDFLKENDFRVPKSMDIIDVKEAKDFLCELGRPIMIKPVDASGSKGVSKVISIGEVEDAFREAKSYSKCGNIIAEEFVQRSNYQIAGDAFLVDGEIRIFGLANEHFDRLCNPLVPIGESFPAKISTKKTEIARSEIQRVMSLLNMKQGAINLDFMFDENGELFILELGPRNGGNLITDAIKEACGVDLGEYTVKAAVGENISDLMEKPYHNFITSYVIHSQKSGNFTGLKYSNGIQSKIIRNDLFISPGDHVERFNNGGFGIGAMLIKFDSQEEMMQTMDHMEDFITVCVE
ncbi:ATP-grasp domain-containing protein [Qiania dongpingensis]|uniref:ATP-grasp domain-containing protein n=1 Tax=Qiania dongpingensis TaxID=2763669 RepID=A0A7G9G7S6_9FIRM|nr:ATP-grasp domain-containing protein [Qiania dongpingensis]QNM06858.1 ATP-grasp domain-containing protein [Qiania dongpingensis]